MRRFLVIILGKHYISPMVLIGSNALTYIAEESKRTHLQYLVYLYNDTRDIYVPFSRIKDGVSYTFNNPFTNIIEVSLDG